MLSMIPPRLGRQSLDHDFAMLSFEVFGLKMPQVLLERIEAHNASGGPSSARLANWNGEAAAGAAKAMGS